MKTRYDYIQILNQIAKSYYNGSESEYTLCNAAQSVIEADLNDCSEIQEPFVSIAWNLEIDDLSGDFSLSDIELTVWDGQGDNSIDINTDDLYLKIEQTAHESLKFTNDIKFTEDCEKYNRY